jgi:hypothetical protein
MALWWRGLVLSSPPSTEENKAKVREIESRWGIGWQLKKIPGKPGQTFIYGTVSIIYIFCLKKKK